MGLLRLLTNKRLMGKDLISQSDAWSLMEQLLGDPRLRYVDEPPGLTAAWKGISRGTRSSTNLWTTTYLLAFAETLDLKVVTFDKGMRAAGGDRVLLLG